jgi:transposase-like protein
MPTDLSTLDGLAAAINAEHALIWRAGREALEHAITCGELLLKAQGQVGTGHWLNWMSDNVGVHPTTAYRYMRLGRFASDLRASDAEGVEEALRSIAGHPWHNRQRIDDEVKSQMVEMAGQHGMTITEIAEAFGCSQSTVWYWVSPKSRAAHVRSQQQMRDRHARVADELTARRNKALARESGGAVADGYSLLRRCLQKVDIARTDEHNREAKAALGNAIAKLHEAEDEMARALKLMSVRKVRSGPKHHQAG